MQFDPPFPVFSSGVLSLFLVRWISIRHFVRSRFTPLPPPASPPYSFSSPLTTVSFPSSVPSAYTCTFRVPFSFTINTQTNVFRKQRAYSKRGRRGRNFEEDGSKLGNLFECREILVVRIK